MLLLSQFLLLCPFIVDQCLWCVMAYRPQHSTITFASPPLSASCGWLQQVAQQWRHEMSATFPFWVDCNQSLLRGCMHPAVVAKSSMLPQIELSKIPHRESLFRCPSLAWTAIAALGAQLTIPASSMHLCFV